MTQRVLIVDDEKNIRRTLAMILRSAGYTISEAGSGEDAIAQLERSPVEVVLLDVGLPGQDGLETLDAIKSGGGTTPAVIMISGQATVSTAIEATRRGAFDFLEKPLSKERVLIALRNALTVTDLGSQVSRLKATEDRRRTLVGDALDIALGSSGGVVIIAGVIGLIVV